MLQREQSIHDVDEVPEDALCLGFPYGMWAERANQPSSLCFSVCFVLGLTGVNFPLPEVAFSGEQELLIAPDDCRHFAGTSLSARLLESIAVLSP